MSLTNLLASPLCQGDKEVAVVLIATGFLGALRGLSLSSFSVAGLSLQLQPARQSGFKACGSLWTSLVGMASLLLCWRCLVFSSFSLASWTHPVICSSGSWGFSCNLLCSWVSAACQNQAVHYSCHSLDISVSEDTQGAALQPSSTEHAPK